MTVGESSPYRADHVALPRLVRYHYVHISFDDDHLPGTLNVRPRQVEPVQDGAFVENNGLRRIEVLGCLPIAQGATAEAHDCAFRIADREDEPVAKAVIMPTRVALGRQTRVHKLLRCIAALEQVITQHIERVGRIADLESLDSGGSKPTLLGI